MAPPRAVYKDFCHRKRSDQCRDRVPRSARPQIMDESGIIGGGTRQVQRVDDLIQFAVTSWNHASML